MDRRKIIQTQNDRSSKQVLERLEMPLDILFEISRYLDPLDILSLGRASRVTRQLVRSAEFKPVWVHARSQYPDLPDCPGNMTEPAYAELLFGDSCLVCGALCDLDSMHYIFAARDRLCVDCFSSRYTFSPEDCEIASSLPARIVHLLPRYSDYRSDGGCLVYVVSFYSNAHLSSWIKQYESAEDQRKWEDAMVQQQEDIIKHALQCRSFNIQWRGDLFNVEKKSCLHIQLGYGDEMKRHEKIIDEQDWSLGC